MLIPFSRLHRRSTSSYVSWEGDEKRAMDNDDADVSLSMQILVSSDRECTIYFLLGVDLDVGMSVQMARHGGLSHAILFGYLST